MAITIGIFVTTSTSAQFTNAVIADNVYSLSTTPTIVNNDILDEGNDIYRVTAFSDAVGPRSGIMWECYFAGNNYTGDLPLNYYSVYSGAVVNYIDVSIVKDINVIHALAVSCIRNGLVTISEDPLSSIYNSAPTTINTLSNPGVIVSRPRISSPNLLGGANEYEVVFECTNNARTYYEMRGYNNAAAVGYKYNIGTFVPRGNTTSVPNHHPVVAYDQQNNVNVGWVLDNSSGAISGAFQSLYPIVVPCDNTGTPTVSTYWETPRAGANFGNYFSLPYLALSGRHSLTYDSTFVSTYSLTNADFLTKSVIINSASSLKVADIKNASTNNLQAFIQTADPLSKYKTTIWNTEGREVSSRNLNLSEIENFIKSNLDNLPSGIYFTRLINDKNQVAFAGKINN
jgi:hypothetical protein